ncbi:MAG: SulP family inorganic anion transporter [Sphaerochaeta sp.]|nr:SulP family inorganic anion transporter [Sphaerochaeta sp.]
MASKGTLSGVSFFHDLKKEFSGYNGAKFSKDLLAGLTVTAVALPLALAFGVSSGLDAASGLITAILAGLVIGGLAGASFQISGPTGAMSAVLVGLATAYGPQGVFFAGMVSGLILLLASVLRIGALINYIPSPVITGFTSGIGIIIALGQVDSFFGTTSIGNTYIAKLLSYGELGFSPHLPTLSYGMLIVLMMVFWPKRLRGKIPASLVGIIVALVAQMFLNLDVAEVGLIPRSLLGEHRLQLSTITLANFKHIISPAISIAALGMIEGLLCGSSGAKMKGGEEKFKANRELFAQGVGNTLIPFFGGIPATAVISRTSVAIKSGGQTRLTSIIHALGLLASMFLLSPFMSRIPHAALSGVLMVTAWRMNDWPAIREIFQKKIKTSIAQFLLTMIAIVVFDLTVAIMLGIAFSMIMFVIKSNKISIEIDDVTKDLLDTSRKTKVVYVDGSLFFGSQELLTAEVELMLEHKVRRIIFSVRGVPNIDHSAVNEFVDIVKMCRDSGVEVLFCGVQPPVMHMFKRLDFVEHLGKGNFYTSVVIALEALS